LNDIALIYNDERIENNSTIHMSIFIVEKYKSRTAVTGR